MKAAVLYEGNRRLEIRELTQDSPKAGEVRVETSAAGICASDHHIIAGTATPFALPAVLGHEGAGTVVEVGPGVTTVKPGDRCIMSFVSSCGHCRPCRSGTPNTCDTNMETGWTQFDGTLRLHDGGDDVYQMTKLGVFGESMITPQQACYPIPEGVPAEVAALIGCSVTTGVGAVINNPAAKTGMTVAVFGCGGVGLNVIQGARLLNASRIIAVDIHDHKLEFTYRFGATDVVNAREADPVEAVHELTGGGVDMAFDAFGSTQTTADVLRSVRKGGTGVVIGLAPDGETAPVDIVPLIRYQKTLMGSYYGSISPHESFGTLVDLYLKGRIEVDGLIVRRYALEQINEGFEALERGEDGRGVIVYD